MTFVMSGAPCAKGNSRVIRTRGRGGRPFVTKSDQANAMVDSYVAQLRSQWLGRPPLTGPIKMVCHIFYADRRRDLDESLVADSLQHAGVLKNDRQVVVKIITKNWDPHHPRTECSVEELPTLDGYRKTVALE